MPEVNVVMNTRRVDAIARVIDIHGEITAFAETALMEAYAHASTPQRRAAARGGDGARRRSPGDAHVGLDRVAVADSDLVRVGRAVLARSPQPSRRRAAISAINPLNIDNSPCAKWITPVVL